MAGEFVGIEYFAEDGAKIDSGIYEIVNLENGKRYIGSTSKFSKRKADHFGALRKGKHPNSRLQNSWNTHGEDSFSFRKLIICDLSMLMFYEQTLLDSLPCEYNLSRRSENVMLGYKHSAETKEKNSKSHLGKPSSRKGVALPEDVRLKVRLANIGKKQSQETIDKRFAWQKGYSHSPETKAKIGASNKGKVRSDEMKERIRAARIGQITPMETRQKLSEITKEFWRRKREELGKENV